MMGIAGGYGQRPWFDAGLRMFARQDAGLNLSGIQLAVVFSMSQPV